MQGLGVGNPTGQMQPTWTYGPHQSSRYTSYRTKSRQNETPW